eukprot:CAMPEP_0181225718 /NCGR_PEP_ID=MMETSP1096-20121128/31854_1 /TAXON_ID=156174 ORGANISM="Chrysochromulina ericina, Strain CCMP281" /NCGR_SAMPLE_ID=MMETSP1096 /ASSEMBLY_ACC=CAM_ASM_000453 /LENGTH=65 /DNA_ID=CAMNT_0023318975 /DNA_START=579 /DNA_END=776 /DNA_ORIENTATION=+
MHGGSEKHALAPLASDPTSDVSQIASGLTLRGHTLRSHPAEILIHILSCFLLDVTPLRLKRLRIR